MIESLYRVVKQWSSLKMIGISLACFIVSFALINGKPFGVAQLKAMTGGVGILDMEFGYSPQAAYELLTALGETGRAFYLHVIVPQDFIFPALYSLFYVVTTTFLFRKAFAETHPIQPFSLLTLLGGLADYAENLCILTMLVNYPAQHSRLASLANVLTIFKYCGIGISAALLLTGILGASMTAARRPRRIPDNEEQHID